MWLDLGIFLGCPGGCARVEIFKGRRFGKGIFGGYLFGPGIFLGVDFCHQFDYLRLLKSGAPPGPKICKAQKSSA